MVACHRNFHHIITKIKESVSNEKLQYLVFIGLSIGVTVLTLLMSHDYPYNKYFGKAHPLAVIIFTAILGIIFLTFLLIKTQLVIFKKRNFRELFLSGGLAAPFAIAIILVDLKVIFPHDLNVLFPQSLLFYPAMGYIVEILFHLLPLSVLVFFFGTFFKKMSYKIMITASIITVSLLEPVYQIISYIGQYPLWTVVYIGVHISLINLVQLLIFKRYDFISMYSFRLVYYILWHILWGYMRIKFLF